MLYQTAKLYNGNKTTFGVDFKQYGGISNSGFAHDSLLLVNELAGYLYSQQTLFKNFTLSAGLRIENHSKFGTEIAPLARNNFVQHTLYEVIRNPGELAEMNLDRSEATMFDRLIDPDYEAIVVGAGTTIIRNMEKTKEKTSGHNI